MIAAPSPGQVKVATRALPNFLHRFDLTQGATLDLQVDGPDDRVFGIDPVGDINGDGWGDLLCRTSTGLGGPSSSWRVSVLSGETLQILWDAFFPGGSPDRDPVSYTHLTLPTIYSV